MSCPMRALDFGPLATLQKNYPDAKPDLPGVPAAHPLLPQ